MVSILEKIEAHLQTHRMAAWEGTFRDYMSLVLLQPALAQRAHARLYSMIHASGVRVDEAGKEHYAFFERDLFGIDEPLAKVVEYFKAAALGSDVGRRILLLYGPPSSGKSQLVILLKRGLEEFAHTDAGAVYAIADCPQHEDPLNLIPHALRREFQGETGIHIEGELCPLCALTLREKYQGDIYKVPVRRIFFSEKERCGIGTFVPSDPKSQDITELTGSIDLSTIGEVGVESDPRAYRFDGELNIANRGVMEFIEMLKVDERFLYVLLTLSQEQNIKTGRFSMIYADEVVVSHTNETEYTAFVGNKKSEALQDRIILVKVPYNLRISDEVRIYEKLLKQSALQTVHIAPHTLDIASIFAVLTRLQPSKKAGISLMKKLKVYNGEDLEEFKQKDIKELQEESEREGMDGISPRYVINRLSNALVKEGITCINPIDALRAMRDGLEQHTSISREQREHYLNLIGEARKEYDDIAKREVQKAFVYSFEEAARTLLNNYLDNVEAYCNKQKMRDPYSDEEQEPDEVLMKSIEEQIGIGDTSRKSFREEILIRISTLARRGQMFDYTSHERLKEAIEKKLFADLRDVVKITTSAKTPDPEQLRRINDVVDRLISEHGYCAVCANSLLQYVGSLLNR